MSGYQSDLKLNDINYVGDFPLENSLGGFGITTGVTDDYVLTLTPSINQYRTGMPFMVIFNHANTGIPSLNVNGKGAKVIKKVDNDILEDIAPGEINTTKIYYLVYDGTYLQLANSIIPTIEQATELIAGIAQIATQTEVNTGTNNSKFVTPQKLAQYVADKVTGLWENKGLIDCSVNPNYPAGQSGDAYTVSIAGKIGGAAGIDVEARDVIYCLNENAGGDQATVGNNWNIVQSNIVIASEAIAGIARIATQAELTAGTSDATFVTPLKLAVWFAAQLATESKAGIVQQATNAEAIAGIDASKYVTPAGMQAKANVLINRETIISIDTSKVNPILRTTPSRNTLSAINGNMIVSRDFRIKSNTTIPTVLSGTHVLNFPKPLNASGTYSGVLLSNNGQQFFYSLDSDGKVTFTGTFNDANDELMFNIKPYIAKFPLEYHPTQPPS